MVLRGQFLERPALVACGELTLEGLWHRGDRAPALLVCAPPAGGGMDAPAVAELAWACARAGHPSLRFQHRGVGASEGAAVEDAALALEDAEAALAHLAASAPGPLAVAGVGGGCDVALALVRAHPELRCAVLVAPEWPPRSPLAVPALAILPEHGALGPDAALAALGPLARAEVLPGADARLACGLPRAGALAVAFLSR